jgi:hypothetical protein
MALALALTTVPAAAPLPRSLRSRYLARIGEALRGRASVGDGELHRLAHGVVRELLVEPREKPLPKPKEEALRGFGVSP